MVVTCVFFFLPYKLLKCFLPFLSYIVIFYHSVAREMAQPIKRPVTKPAYLSSVSRPYMVNGENQLL